MTLMFSLMIFWPGAYTGPKATVNCANSQVALDDTAERRSVHVKHAYVMECVEAETGRHGEKRHLTETEDRQRKRQLRLILKAKELVAGKNRKMESCRRVAESRMKGERQEIM